MNSIRIPFHYKLFTNEDYMGFMMQTEALNFWTELYNGINLKDYTLFLICTTLSVDKPEIILMTVMATHRYLKIRTMKHYTVQYGKKLCNITQKIQPLLGMIY